MRESSAPSSKDSSTKRIAWFDERMGSVQLQLGEGSSPLFHPRIRASQVASFRLSRSLTPSFPFPSAPLFFDFTRLHLHSITTLDIELSKAYPLAAAQVHSTLHVPPVAGLTEEELRRQMRAIPDSAIWSIVWLKRWVIWWAWLRGMLSFGRSRGGSEQVVEATKASSSREELGGRS